MIIGIGIDIVDLDRIQRMIDRHGLKFLNRTFTEAEIAYCQGRKKPAQHFAGRFAAKEAVFKAFGTGWREGMGWKEIEVQVDPLGRPRLRLAGKAASKARDLGVSELLISISHCDCHAIAQVVAVGRDDQMMG
ncbi:MAG TPA: holo-ACP synthase [Planctomycetota bacterium]|nr:holo-ACP synthase [Planctomycetota bacterium]